MVQRTHIVPVAAMARVLAVLPPAVRRNASAAAAAIEAAGYFADDVAAGLSQAMAGAEDLALEAANRRGWVLALCDLRDILSLAVVVAAIAAWALPK